MDQIDQEPLQPGFGMIWQGSELDDFFDKVPHPRCVVSVVGECAFGPAVVCAMVDDDVATLPDPLLLAVCDGALGFLRNGYNLFIHCVEGKYRSTYMDVAIHMRTGMLFEDAFALVRRRHTIAELRAGTKAQLKRMESTLNGGSK